MNDRMSAHEEGTIPQCDRCGLVSRFSHLTGYPCEGETYWLCADCELAVVTVWLAEHAYQIERRREKKKEHERGQSGH